MDIDYEHLYDARGWLIRGEIGVQRIPPRELFAYGRVWPGLAAHFSRAKDGRIAICPRSYSFERLAGFAQQHERVKRRLMRAVGARAVQRAKRADAAKTKAAKP